MDNSSNGSSRLQADGGQDAAAGFQAGEEQSMRGLSSEAITEIRLLWEAINNADCNGINQWADALNYRGLDDYAIDKLLAGAK